MTDRYHSLVVTLEHDIREDDADALINAICMMKGVQAVHGNVASSNDFAVKQRERTRIERALQEAVHNIVQEVT